jgi:hypothetical protein
LLLAQSWKGLLLSVSWTGGEWWRPLLVTDGTAYNFQKPRDDSELV